MANTRPIDPRAIHNGLEFIGVDGRKLHVLEYAFTGMGNLVVRVKEVDLDGTLVDFEETMNLGKPQWLIITV